MFSRVIFCIFEGIHISHKIYSMIVGWRSGSSLSCTNEVAGSNPGLATLCAFGFQYMLASTGFSSGAPAFLLHSKTDFGFGFPVKLGRFILLLHCPSC